MNFLPYTNVEEKDNSSIGNGTLKDLSKLVEESDKIKTIVKERVGDCKKLLDSLAIDKIEDFANELITLLEDEDYIDLQAWCKDLKFAASLFDVDKIEKILNEWVSAGKEKKC